MTTKRYRTKKVGGKNWLEHRWVWTQANGPIPDGYQIHHIDHDGFNNDLSNLELVSTKDHGLKHSIQPRVKSCEVCGSEYEPAPTKRKRAQTCGPDCRAELLSRRLLAHYGKDERDDEIRRLFHEGITNAELSERFGLSPPSITRITRHGGR